MSTLYIKIILNLFFAFEYISMFRIRSKYAIQKSQTVAFVLVLFCFLVSLPVDTFGYQSLRNA